MNKGQKMVKVVELMSHVGGVKADYLMERFDIDARTLRRYLSDLRSLGLPIVDDGYGDDRLVSMEPRYRRTGVQLSLAEVLSLHFGRKLFNFLDGTTFAEDLDGAIERMEPAISRAHQDLARELDTKFLAVPEPTKNYRGQPNEVLDDVITALVYNNPLEARYRKASGVQGHYVLHPYTLATFRQGLYLFAFDTVAGRVKTFAIERFVDMARRRREHFTVPVGWTPEAHIAHAFGIISGQPQDVVLAIDKEIEAYIRERTWHPSQTHRTLPDGRMELRLQVAITVELSQWILSFGHHLEVISPPELRQQTAAVLKKAAERYQNRP